MRCTLSFPASAFFVVIRTTPLEPLEPYIAVASASFKTSMLSISLGLMVLSGLIEELGSMVPDKLEGLSEIMGTPSTMYSGLFPARLKLFLPLI